MFLVDSHCHLNLLDVSQGFDITQYIQRAKNRGIGHILNVSVTLATFPAVLKTAEQYDCVSASVGLHPNEESEEVDVETLIQLGQSKKVIGIGETGLDYFRSTGDLAWQHKRFRAHIQAARALKKPLIIHTRDASVDTLRILQEENAQEIGGVMHCFTENWEIAEAALALNFLISISGIVTFKNAQTVQTVATKVPLDRLLVETDAPYLAPNPYRGKPNEPAYVHDTAEYIATLRGISLEALAEQTTQNFFTLFTGAAFSHV